jgi:hypothetical protein
VSFPSAVDEHERARGARPHRCELPRIDSEKTLVRTDDGDDENGVPRLAKSKSAESGSSGKEQVEVEKREDHCVERCVDEKCDAQCHANCPEPEGGNEESAPRLSRTRKMLLGMVTMLNVLIAVSPPNDPTSTTTRSTN